MTFYIIIMTIIIDFSLSSSVLTFIISSLISLLWLSSVSIVKIMTKACFFSPLMRQKWASINSLAFGIIPKTIHTSKATFTRISSCAAPLSSRGPRFWLTREQKLWQSSRISFKQWNTWERNRIGSIAEHGLDYLHKVRFETDTHRLEQNERLCKEIAEEMVMGQSNALKVSCGVDLL